MTRGRIGFVAGLALIGGLALTLRLWYVTTLPGQRIDIIESDMRTFDYTAWQFARGLPMAGEMGLHGLHPLGASTYYGIGYTHFLAGLYALFGHDYRAVRLAQAVLGTLTTGIVALFGALCFGRRQGLLAAALTAAYLPLVYYEGLLLTETWFTFLQMSALWLWLLAWRWGTPVNGGPAPGTIARVSGLLIAMLSGVATGLASLTRPAFIPALVLLPAGAWLFPPLPAPRGRRLALAASFFIAAAAVIAPITIRNYQIHERFVLVSTNGPASFLTGLIKNSGLPDKPSAAVSDVVASDRYRAQVYRYLASHWRQYLAEMPERCLIVWTGSDFWPASFNLWILHEDRRSRADVSEHRFHSPPFGNITYYSDLTRYVDRVLWGLVGLPLGLLAVFFLPRSNRGWSVVYLAMVPYLIIPFIAYPFARYRVPAAPLCFVFAAQTFTAAWDYRVRCHRQTNPISADGSDRCA